ncbi:hypothetical protein SASPL_149043 [Salvia splendens]|uniref:FAD-binding domain-containing protein n=1 Tax=Salvia splendens TaxID=180675 RepID=A0A8X8WA65_SALSN|nr:hypothetical protein SASPL_149043 [Salvia splendens]
MEIEKLQTLSFEDEGVVGGTIAGLSCAHALITAGWGVVVLEKTSSPATGCATGAGLGLDPLSQKLIKSWLDQPHMLDLTTLPLTIDQALPPGTVHWGQTFLSFRVSDDEDCVKVKLKASQSGEVTEVVGDLLVAADGCLSSIRQSFFPELKLRGVLDFSNNEDSDTILGLKKAFPDLGKCLYFDLGSGTQSVFYELLNKRINWIWYVNQPEPQLKGNSVTMKVSSDMIAKMHEAAEKVWLPELMKVIRETKDPFLNVIYDCEPLGQIFWQKVVLIGDAAHATTPQGLRSTNMSILDAAVLGKCLEKWGVGNLASALQEYQATRLPVTTEQVLFSQRLGRIKQGLQLPDRQPLDPRTAWEDCEELQQKKMPFLSDKPSILSHIKQLED